eukprot:gene2549-525_t
MLPLLIAVAWLPTCTAMWHPADRAHKGPSRMVFTVFVPEEGIYSASLALSRESARDFHNGVRVNGRLGECVGESTSPVSHMLRLRRGLNTVQ